MIIDELYYNMLQIRFFEEKVLQLFSDGKLFGTTHAYIGQEANAVGVISNLDNRDTVVSNHRCHGHYLVHKQNPYGLLCEMMGKESGLCAGRGGSQHICDEGFFSNGIQGGIMPLAAGIAFSNKFKKNGNIVVVFIGDGTLGEGVLYESLNIISKWEIPLLVVVENNMYAQSTKIEDSLAGDIKSRFTAFGIRSEELSTFDVTEIYKAGGKMVNYVRKNTLPSCLILNTYRFSSHSKSDDGRDLTEVEKWKKRDPLKIVGQYLDKAVMVNIENKVKHSIEMEIGRALDAPMKK